MSTSERLYIAYLLSGDLEAVTASHQCPGCLIRWGAARLTTGGGETLTMITPDDRRFTFTPAQKARLLWITRQHQLRVETDVPERKKSER